MDSTFNENWLSDELIRNGIDLSDYGIASIAWEYPMICDAIDLAFHKNKIILGGDVFVMENGNPVSRGDSWYYNKTDHNDIANSYQVAKDYVTNYKNHMNGLVFALVVI